MKLTEKEQIVLKALKEYGSAQYLYNTVQNFGWGCFPDEKALGGVLSSLIKKGLISDIYQRYGDNATCFTFTETGKEIIKQL